MQRVEEIKNAMKEPPISKPLFIGLGNEGFFIPNYVIKERRLTEKPFKAEK